MGETVKFGLYKQLVFRVDLTLTVVQYYTEMGETRQHQFVTFGSPRSGCNSDTDFMHGLKIPMCTEFYLNDKNLTTGCYPV